MGGYKFTKVLMDGGSSINILYYETFRRMGLVDKNLSQSNTIFHGVVPGKSAYLVGKIELEVAFGDENNYRVEKLTFEVVKKEARTMLYLGGRLTPSSWLGRVMCTYSSRCRVIMGPSRFTAAGRWPWNVRKAMQLMQNLFVQQRS